MIDNLTVPQVPLGTTGLHVSRVGLGSWAMGGPWERGWGAQDDAESIAAIRHALELGVTWIDTAAVYGHGHAEEVVGDLVAALPEADRPLVFTKCGRKRDASGALACVGEPASIRAEVEGSLRRLRTEHVDVMQLHWPPTDGTPLAETWATLVALQTEGEVGFIGACNVTAEQLAELEAVAHVDVLQPPLSLVDRRFEPALDLAAAHGTGAIVYSPMQSGLLTGAFDAARITAMDDGDWRKTDAHFTEPRLSANLALVARMREVAADLGATVAELAVAWTLHRRGVSAAIVGARRPAQVDGWVRGGSLALSPEVVAELAGAGA